MSETCRHCSLVLEGHEKAEGYCEFCDRAEVLCGRAKCERLERERDRLRALLMASLAQSFHSESNLHHSHIAAWESVFEYLEGVGLMTGDEYNGYSFTIDPWDEFDRTEGWDG